MVLEDIEVQVIQEICMGLTNTALDRANHTQDTSELAVITSLTGLSDMVKKDKELNNLDEFKGIILGLIIAQYVERADDDDALLGTLGSIAHKLTESLSN